MTPAALTILARPARGAARRLTTFRLGHGPHAGAVFVLALEGEGPGTRGELVAAETGARYTLGAEAGNVGLHPITPALALSLATIADPTFARDYPNVVTIYAGPDGTS